MKRRFIILNNKWINLERPAIKRKDLENVLTSMIEEKINYGECAKEFEKKWSEFTSLKKSLALNSFYNAFSLALEALNIAEKNEIILPSFAPQLYLNVIHYKKAVPVLVDLDEHELKPSLEMVKLSLTKNTKAIILPYYFGYAYDPAPYIELFPNVIEDASSVIGMNWKEYGIAQKSLFTICDFAKGNLITTGDGAFIASNDKGAFSKLVSLTEANYSLDPYTPHIACLMPDLNASMGISQLENLKHRLILQEKIGNIYEEAVNKSHGASLLQETSIPRVYCDFPIKLKSNPKEVIKFFNEQNIEVKRPYEHCLHHYLKKPKNYFPWTERLFLNTINVPIYSALLKKDVELIAKTIAALI